METLEELKEGMRGWSDENLESERKYCFQVAYVLPQPTPEDRAQARLNIQAIEEVQRERKAARIFLENLREQEENERQAQIMARALQINEDRKAAAQEPQQITQPERVEKTKAEIRAVLRRGFLAHFEEYYSIVAQTAKTRKAGAGKRAAAQMLLAAYNAHGLINKIALPYFTNWLDLWYPITGIRGSDDNYKASKLDAGYYLPAEKFSPDLRAILYPDINQ